jgi:hypothetical protein
MLVLQSKRPAAPLISTAATFTGSRASEGRMFSGLGRLGEVEDLRCSHCGKKVLAPRYFDTRMQFYCGPDCWEGEDSRTARRF